MRCLYRPGKENFEFALGKPNLTVTRSFSKCKADLRRLGVPYKKYIRDGSGIFFRGKLPGYDVELEICVRAFFNRVVCIDFYRTDEYGYSINFDIYRSYREFSDALEKLYGEPQSREPQNEYGEIREEWETPYRIKHYLFERFGLTEHLTFIF